MANAKRYTPIDRAAVIAKLDELNGSIAALGGYSHEFTRIERNRFMMIHRSKPAAPSIGNQNILDRDKVLAHADSILKYEEKLHAWTEDNALYAEDASFFNTEVTARIEKTAGIDKVPPECRSNVLNSAYERGHSSGVEEYGSYLKELCDLFEPLKYSGDPT